MDADPWEGVYRRGLAIGNSDIKTDCVNFTFRDEAFSFPTVAVVGTVAKWNGYWYEARVTALRKLAKEKNKNGLRRKAGR